MLLGSCLCGAVTYKVTGEPGELGHCYCKMCQKSHGAAFGTYVNVSMEHFEFLTGEEELRRYISSPGITRTFCGQCGSNIQFLREGKPYFGLVVGSLDTDIDVKPSYQIWTSSKPCWLARDKELSSNELQGGRSGT